VGVCGVHGPWEHLTQCGDSGAGEQRLLLSGAESDQQPRGVQVREVSCSFTCG